MLASKQGKVQEEEVNYGEGKFSGLFRASAWINRGIPPLRLRESGVLAFPYSLYFAMTEIRSK